MHEIEFEIRISDQIQTVKMAVGRQLKFNLNITNSHWQKIAPGGRKFTKHTCEVKSELAELTDSIARQATESHAPCSHIWKRL
jgi:hypothetical protein